MLVTSSGCRGFPASTEFEEPSAGASATDEPREPPAVAKLPLAEHVVQRPTTPARTAGTMESVVLNRRQRDEDGPLFESIEAKTVGIDFYHEKNSDPFLSPELAIGSGVAMGDYDDDGLVDIFLPRSSDGGMLFRNLGRFRFEDVTAEAGIHGNDERWTTGATFVDIDNDGDLDLFVCGYGCPNHLYINQGDGTFLERGHDYGLDLAKASVMIAFADYDRDGDLDAYLVTYHIPPQHEIVYKLKYGERGIPHVPEKYLEYRDTIRLPDGEYTIIATGEYDYLFRNNGDGTFSDVTEAAGIRGAETQIRGNDRGLAAIWWDYNDDSRPDLYVANDFFGADRLYQNNGDGTFTDTIASAVPHTPWFSTGCDVGDINNDGLIDFMGTDMSERTEYRQIMTRRDPRTSGWFFSLPIPRQYVRNAVYLNTGTERFNEVAYLTGMASTNWTWSSRFVDLDLDGYLDAHITNGMSHDLDNNDLKKEAQQVDRANSEAYRRFWQKQPMLPQRNFAFRNMGELQFENVSQSWGLDYFGLSFGTAFGDLDNDGDLDLVINNYEDWATIARNTKTGAHAVRIRLRGAASNRWGVGATVQLRAGGKLQSRYLTLARGFMSSSDPTLHFGLGNVTLVDRLIIDWPSGQRQELTDLPVDHLYTVTEPNAPEPASQAGRETKQQPLFKRSQALDGMRHVEEPFDDFAREPLLPFRLSQLGPAMAVGDVNGDRLEDLFHSGAKGGWGTLMINSGDGKWTPAPELFPPWTEDEPCEQLGVLLFDADSDDDLDLFVVSGGVECEPGDESLRDRLYLNDGSGSFRFSAPGQVPDLRDSGSVVAAADYDHDGDLDLFIGGRCVPGRFPDTPHSRLLRNRNGQFVDATGDIAPEILDAGLVTSALWSDANDDGWIDLLLACEWGPIKLFINEYGKLTDATELAGLPNLLGFWNGIAGRDLDGDGDMDYVATNLGLNTTYRLSADRPARLFYGDFNNDGGRVLLEGKYDEQGRLVSARGKLDVQRAIPFVETALPTFHDFASATLSAIVGQPSLDRSLQLAANTNQNVLLRNDGKGHFDVEPLPLPAQFAPGFGVVLSDLDADGLTDLYLVQNSFAPPHDVGRMDGGVSVLFLGQHDGSLLPTPCPLSGLVVPGDAKSVVMSDLNNDGWPDLVVGMNDAETIAFEHQRVPGRRMAKVRLEGRTGNPTAVGARVTLRRNDGLIQSAEIQAGGGYLSQQSAALYFGLGPDSHVESIEVRWPDGQSTRQSPPTDVSEAITITQPRVPAT